MTDRFSKTIIILFNDIIETLLRILSPPRTSALQMWYLYLPFLSVSWCLDPSCLRLDWRDLFSCVWIIVELKCAYLSEILCILMKMLWQKYKTIIMSLLALKYLMQCIYLYGISFSINHFLRSLNSRKHSLIRQRQVGHYLLKLTLNLMLT